MSFSKWKPSLSEVKADFKKNKEITGGCTPEGLVFPTMMDYYMSHCALLPVSDTFAHSTVVLDPVKFKMQGEREREREGIGHYVGTAAGTFTPLKESHG